MEDSAKYRNYRRAQKGNVKPYLDLMKLRRRLCEWLDKTPCAEVESATNLSLYDVRVVVDDLYLSLTTNEIHCAQKLLEEKGEAAAIIFIDEEKGEDL